MRAELQTRVIERTIVIDAGDMITLARNSGLWPKDAELVEFSIDEERQEARFRIQSPEDEDSDSGRIDQ